MGDGRWEMGDGRWEMGDGRWEMRDGANGGKVKPETHPPEYGHIDEQSIVQWKVVRAANGG